MLPALTDVQTLLTRWREIQHVRVLDYESDVGIIVMYKIRCDLPSGYNLQIRLRQRGHAIEYSYQLFTNVPIIRWDNAPHHPAIATYPHHFHNEKDEVCSSNLSGNPLTDLQQVIPIALLHIQTH